MPKSEQENTDYFDAFTDVKPNIISVVIGITDRVNENVWTNFKGEKLNFTKWDKDEPNDYGYGQDYATFWMPGAPYKIKIPKAWDDVHDNLKLGIICEISSCSTSKLKKLFRTLKLTYV